MFDSDIIPLVTRVEAGQGIILTYKTNSDNEAVWTASIDSDYLISIIESRQGSDSDFQEFFAGRIENNNRLNVIEEILGINYVPSSPSTPLVDSDFIISITVNGPTYAEMQIRWKIVSFDGDPIVIKTLKISKDASVKNILNALAYAINKDVSAMQYIQYAEFNDSFNAIELLFKESFRNFSFKIDHIAVTGSTKFTVSQ
jgi:hypothetical protein